MPFGGEAGGGGAPRPPSPPSSQPGAVAPRGRGEPRGHGDTTDSTELYTEPSGQKATMKSVPRNGHETPPAPAPPNPVPQTQICCTGESDMEQHKTIGDGDRSPLPHHAMAPPRPLSAGERPAQGKSLKTRGWGVAGNKLICTEVLGGRGDGRDRRRRAVPPERRGVPAGCRGLRNHMPVKLKPRNDAQSDGERWGEGEITPAHAGAEPCRARGGRGPLHAEALRRGEPRGSLLGWETPGLSPRFQGSTASPRTRRLSCR